MKFGRDLRELFPGATHCLCTAEGIGVDPERLSLRSMNFGQHWRTPQIEDVPYSVEIPFDYFVAFLRENLPEHIRDLQAHGDFVFPFERMLESAGWPSAEAAAQNPGLAAALADYYGHDLLLHWLGDGPPDREPGYVLNTITEISRSPAGMKLAGSARRSGIPVRYQDL